MRFVGGRAIMGLGYNAKQDKLYATDWNAPHSTLYVVDTKNGFLTPMADIGHPRSHGLVALMLKRRGSRAKFGVLAAACGLYATIRSRSSSVR